MNRSVDGVPGRRWIAYGSDGHRIGAVTQVIGNGRTRRAEWLVVDPSPYGDVVKIVPLRGATFRGHRVVLDFDRDTIAAAPAVDLGGDALGEDEASRLRRYYELDGDYSSWQPS